MKKPGFGNKVLIILISALIVMVGSAFFVNNSIQSIIDEISEEAKPDERLILLKEVMFNISNAENSVKSYGITQDENYLNNYNITIKRVDSTISLLLEQAQNDKPFKTGVSRIQLLLKEKFDVLDNLLLVQSQQSVNLLIGKVQERVGDLNEQNGNVSPNHIAENGVVDKETAENKNFFKRVLENRKKKMENKNQKTETIEVDEAIEKSFVWIDQELDELKKQEMLVEFELKKRELSLIQANKAIMDEISVIVHKLEETEQIKMQNQIKEADNQRTSTAIIIAIFCIISCILLAFAGYVIHIYIKRNNLYKKALRSSKQETESKNREIVSSITYAKRIQSAIMPDSKKIQRLFKESFIIYKPKDIVAGDFYWITQIDGYDFIAVADCTGHGVPGAMVSMTCSSALSRSVKEFGLRKPSAILEKCRDLIIEAFDEGDLGINDGMDVSLCRLEKSTNKIQFSGANNSLYIINDAAVNVVKADRQPVGRYQHLLPFTNYEITMDKNDTFLIFTDGITDQFGGPKGKKFMYKNFRKIMENHGHLTLTEFQEKILKILKSWQGKLEQIDDICVIGFRV